MIKHLKLSILYINGLLLIKNNMKKVDLRLKYEEETGKEYHVSASPTIEYCNWLEEQLINSFTSTTNPICNTFFPDMSSTAITKCMFCGKEKWEHPNCLKI
jgi:hypothetical protein